LFQITVIAFDNLGNRQYSTACVKQFSIKQFADDTPGLIDAVKNQES